MTTELKPDENVLKKGSANMQRGAETVGGTLTLTDQRLLFDAHKLNIQTGATEVPLADIRETTPVWTKFLGAIPLAPNSLAVTTTDGTENRFVLAGRGTWKQAIDAAVGR